MCKVQNCFVSDFDFCWCILSHKCCEKTTIPWLNQLHLFNGHCIKTENEVVKTLKEFLYSLLVLLLVPLTEIKSNCKFQDRSFQPSKYITIFFFLLFRSSCSLVVFFVLSSQRMSCILQSCTLLVHWLFQCLPALVEATAALPLVWELQVDLGQRWEEGHPFCTSHFFLSPVIERNLRSGIGSH